jgi:hypothetical protein
MTVSVEERAAAGLEQVFPNDVLSKRERVERALAFQPVDRVPIHEQVSYNPAVVAHYIGREVRGFDFTLDDVCAVIRQTLDACFPPFAPTGTDRITDADGFVIQHDNWTSWTVSRPFADIAGARAYLLRRTRQIECAPWNPQAERARYHAHMADLQRRVGDTVIIDYPVGDGFCDAWSKLTLPLFAYLYAEDPRVVHDFVQARTDWAVRWIQAVADPALSPVALIAEDFSTKQGPIFSPALLRKEHFPGVSRLAEAWHSRGMKVIYHSDGNFRLVIPDLIETGVDGFYCLEPAVGMDIVEFRRRWPEHFWAGGIDGVDLMEQGTPEQVRAEVHRVIRETDALQRGGIFVDTSAEINPPIKVENYVAMIQAAGELTNPAFAK